MNFGVYQINPLIPFKYRNKVQREYEVFYCMDDYDFIALDFDHLCLSDVEQDCDEILIRFELGQYCIWKTEHGFHVLFSEIVSHSRKQSIYNEILHSPYTRDDEYCVLHKGLKKTSIRCGKKYSHSDIFLHPDYVSILHLSEIFEEYEKYVQMYHKKGK